MFVVSFIASFVVRLLTEAARRSTANRR